MTNIIKRIISKRSKVRKFEYTGGSESIPKNVTHVQFHPSVTKVHDEAFKDCIKLNEVVFSDGITIIGNESFKGCTKLKRVVLNDGLKQIGHDAFRGCTSLDSITFPSTVTKIGNRAFKNCSGLKENIYTRSGVDYTIDYGLNHFRGCPVAVRKYRLTNIVEISHLKELEKKIDAIDGSTIQVRDGYLIVPLPQAIRLQSMEKVVDLLRYYEIKETTTLIELALWKAMIGQTEEEDHCHVELPGPAKHLILKYTYPLLHRNDNYRYLTSRM